MSGKRDYLKDLEICEAASPQPWEYERWGGIRAADGRFVAKIFLNEKCVANGKLIALTPTALPWYIKRCMKLESQLAVVEGHVGVLRNALENLLRIIEDGESCREYVNGELANYIGNAVDPEGNAVNEAERILSLTTTQAEERVRKLEAVMEAAKEIDKHCCTGSKADRADYGAIISCDILWRLHKALQVLAEGGDEGGGM